jgi:hypothetical protein
MDSPAIQQGLVEPQQQKQSGEIITAIIVTAVGVMEIMGHQQQQGSGMTGATTAAPVAVAVITRPGKRHKAS